LLSNGLLGRRSCWFLSLNGLAAILAAAAGVLEGSGSSSRGCGASFVRLVVAIMGQDAWRQYY
jgi:hypothetical protein